MLLAEKWLGWLLLLIGAGLFALSNSKLAQTNGAFVPNELAVRLPPLLQVVTSFGDRHLAANTAVLRVLLNRTDLDTPEHFAAQAKVQEDAAILNPLNEDNYYLAAALLSWSGHVSEAEFILRRATEARQFDMLPPFFLAFNLFHFDRKADQGARWMFEAARRADSERNRASLSRIASRWAEQGEDPEEALRLVNVLVAQARNSRLRQYLQLRADRLQGLVTLRRVDQAYRGRYGKPANSLEQYVAVGLLKSLPIDPLGSGYSLDDKGIPQLNVPTPAAEAKLRSLR